MAEEQTVWEQINIPLPPLTYGITEVSGQGKGSTTWAAHSHTPWKVGKWSAFDELVDQEAARDHNQRRAETDISLRLRFINLKVIKGEEDVTGRLESVLDQFCHPDAGSLCGEVEFCQTSKHIKAEPDLIAEKKDYSVWGAGDVSQIVSPKKGKKAAQRCALAEQAVSLYLFPFETKPHWKFTFMQGKESNGIFVQDWEVPDNFAPENMRDQDQLPSSWTNRKKKIFHLIRQLYGQMCSANRKYGIMHTYESWYFCNRTLDGELLISRCFGRQETSPSVFQAIKTMVNFPDYELGPSRVRPSSARKALKKARGNSPASASGVSKPMPPKPPPGPPRKQQGGTQGRPPKGPSASSHHNVAKDVYLWDCDFFDATNTVQLFTLNTNELILVKMQRHSRVAHVAQEMKHEAEMYEAFQDAHILSDVTAQFLGYSDHLGVAMSCFYRELDDFEDIGVENLSTKLRESALKAVVEMSETGVLHNDLALRNFVQSRADPTQAKIIDFGRSTFSDNKERLAKQVETAKALLRIRAS